METTAWNFQGCLALANARAKFPCESLGVLVIFLLLALDVCNLCSFPIKLVIWFLPEIDWHSNRMRTECKVAGNDTAHNFYPDLTEQNATRSGPLSNHQDPGRA
ncbi:hypothetical protein KI387_041076, partial [Taxus chinensis]